jgi:hypothetical protein|tara:strand:+ start:1151 stop:1405 length:255 start_codon:yes stop_codon:yes gene_type:complete
MNNQTGRFVYNQQMVILEYNLERDILWLPLVGNTQFCLDSQYITAQQAVSRPELSVVYPKAAFLYPVLQLGPGILGKQFRSYLV